MGIRTVSGIGGAGQDAATSQPTRRAWLPDRSAPSSPDRRCRIPEVTVIALTGDHAELAVRGLAAALTEVAAAAFAAPPWNETPAHARRLAVRMIEDAQGPGFALALAFTGGGTGLAGFGYGLRRPPTPGVGAGHLPFADAEPFEFCELAVRPAARGVGAGRALHDAILRTSGPQPRWLVTHPAAEPAVRLYQTSGWQIRRVFASSADGSNRLLMTRHR